MRKEILIERQIPICAMTDTNALRKLLHARWELSEAGSLSLISVAGGVRIVAFDTEHYRPVLSVAKKAESIVSEALGKERLSSF